LFSAWVLALFFSFSGLSVKAQKEMGSWRRTGFSRIPEGKGPYSVGCTDLMTDRSVEGSFLRLYYPSQNGTSSEETKWIPKRKYYCGLSDFLNCYRMPKEQMAKSEPMLTTQSVLFSLGSVTCPAKWNAAFKTGEKYPLIIFSHGLGAFRTLYSAVCIEMASQGFVVAAVEHRDNSSSATYYYTEKPVSEAQEEALEELQEEWLFYKKLKRGEPEFPVRQLQVQQRADECIRALNLILGINSGKQMVNVLRLNFDWTLLKDSIDLNRIAMMGHSFGAATAIETLSKEARFKCAIALDAWMLPLADEVYTRVHQPLLFINSEKFQWASNVLKMKKLDSTDVDRKMITIRGSVHQSFPDFTFVAGNLVGKFFKLKGEIDPNMAIDISNRASLAFLQKHLGKQLYLTLSYYWSPHKATI
uniref:Platelet-activating factor acetylhydrolase n=1 Tax=Sphenodon punctatus TaxID=8508 RepID=A0A8D0HSH9_SPHPU